jgi:hypothetical protein
MAVGSTEEAKLLAQRWLEDAEGYSGQVVDPSPDKLMFLFIGKGHGDIPFLITQSITSKRSIAVIVNVNISESSQKGLSEMREENRKEFLWDLKREIMFAPANFAFDPEFEKTGIPRAVQFSKMIYFDDLSESRLAEVVDYTIRSALWLIWSFGRIFGPPSEVKPVE